MKKNFLLFSILVFLIMGNNLAGQTIDTLIEVINSNNSETSSCLKHIKYDDGNFEHGRTFNTQLTITDGRFVQLFKPKKRLIKLKNICIVLRNTNSITLNYEIVIYKNLNGIPGDLIKSYNFEDLQISPDFKFYQNRLRKVVKHKDINGVFVGIKYNPSNFKNVEIGVDTNNKILTGYFFNTTNNTWRMSSFLAFGIRVK